MDLDKRTLSLVLMLGLHGGLAPAASPESLAQTTAPRNEIPSGLSPEMRTSIEDLYSSSPARRAMAARKIGEMGERAAPAIPFLVGILGESHRLRNLNGATTSPGQSAAYALADMGKPCLEALLSAVTAAKPATRGHATEALWTVATQDANKDLDFVQVFASLLQDDYFDVIQNAADALADLGDRRAVDYLIKALVTNPQHALHLVNELARFKDPRSVGPLLAAMKGAADSHARSRIIQALGTNGDSQATEPLINALGDADTGVRVEAARALGVFRDARAGPGLIVALDDTVSAVRTAAATSLGGLNDTRAVQPLIDRLKDPDEFVQVFAAVALGSIGDERALKPLQDALARRPTQGQIQEAVEKIQAKRKN